MSKHPVFCFNFYLTRISDGHQHPEDSFAALAAFKVIFKKARNQTHHELLRNTPSSPGAKFLIASSALRAYRKIHLGTLMRCCAAWEPVGKCFDQCPFECTDFHGLSQIIATLTRERMAEKETEIHNLPWTQTRLVDPRVTLALQFWSVFPVFTILIVACWFTRHLGSAALLFSPVFCSQ